MAERPGDEVRTQSGELLVGTAVDALQAIDQAVIVAGADGRIAFCNHAAESITEWSTARAVGRHLVGVLLPNATEHRISQIMLGLQAGQSWSRAYDVHRDDGSTIVVSVTCTPVFDPQGALSSVIAVSRIMAGGGRPDQLVDGGRRLLHATVQTVGDIVAVADEHGIFSFVDGPTFEQYGVAPETLVGTDFLSLVPKGERERAAEWWSRRIESTGPMPAETTWLRRSDRSWFCLRILASNHLADPAVGGVVLGLRDVTEMKRAEYAQVLMSEAKRILVSASTEAELYEHICRLVVSELTSLTAWVVLEEQHRPLGMHLAAGDRIATEFFRALEGLAGSDNVPDPLTMALITGSEQLVSDAETLPESVAWRNVMHEHGFRSLLVLPFRIGSDETGLLVSAADRSYVFEAPRVTLMKALADDLSRGVEVVRTREQRTAYRDRIETSLEAAVRAIAAAAALRDPYTAGHQRRVADLAVAIAEEMGIEPDFVSGIRVAALIHDIGKLAVPTEILSRPGKLSSAEFELIKGHAQAGYDIIADIDFPWDIAEMILQHHERLDGSGYPSGLEGDEICIGARILAVADTVEAMQAHRPYRAALGIEAALRVISSDRGILFDPAVTDACIRLFNEQRFRFGD